MAMPPPIPRRHRLATSSSGWGAVEHHVGEFAWRAAQACIEVIACDEALQLRFAVDHQHLLTDRRAGQVLEGQLQLPLREAMHMHAGLFGLLDQCGARLTISENRAHPVQGAQRAQQQVMQEREQQDQPQGQ